MQGLSGFRAPTLRTVWADYKQTRHLKPITVRNYEQRLNQHLKDWLDQPVTNITKDMVESRHRAIKGHAMANSTMRTLRALLHYAAVKYEDESGAPLIKANPVRRLSELRAWHRDKRRRSVLALNQLRPWMNAVFSLENSTVRDMLLTLLFTGMRRAEVLSLRWENVDLEAGTILIRNPKNNEDCLIPMSTYIWKIMAMRRLGARGPWVFPGKNHQNHLSPGNRATELVTARCGIAFCLHDLRRTFVTIGDEVDLNPLMVKALVNHRSGDETEGYTVRSTERLRRATEKIAAAILHYAGLDGGGLKDPR